MNAWNSTVPACISGIFSWETHHLIFTFKLSFLNQFTSGAEVNIYSKNEQCLEDNFSVSPPPHTDV